METPRGDKYILVIDDDLSIREMLAISLNMYGYSVLTASNGQEGLSVLKTMPTPCTILLDLMMPIMDGWEFLKEIKTTNRSLEPRVVVLTAYVEKATVSSASVFLKKPVDLDDLMKIVDEKCA
jgi:CheY-like chemotaxis protein